MHTGCDSASSVSVYSLDEAQSALAEAEVNGAQGNSSPQRTNWHKKKKQLSSLSSAMMSLRKMGSR